MRNYLIAELGKIDQQIVAICDVFDALTSARPYKAAWTVDAATDYLRSQAGRHFDPELIRSFLGILPQIIAIRDSFVDEADSELPIDERIDIQR